MVAPTSTRFRVLREVPITPPADRGEYRKYRIDQALSDLPDDAGDELRDWIVEIENKRLDDEQG
jgi:hypothetical protein